MSKESELGRSSTNPQDAVSIDNPFLWALADSISIGYSYCEDSHCGECNRSFDDSHALRQHLASSNLHNGGRSGREKPLKPWMSGYSGRGNVANPFRSAEKASTVSHISYATSGPLVLSPRAAHVEINCDRCAKRSLNRHWHCNICADGNYDLCLSCLKAGGDCGHPMFGRGVRNGTIVHPCGRERCFFEGPTREALEAHYAESSVHGICLKCWPRPDFGSKEALAEHWRSSPKHDWCEHCNKDFGNANNLREVSNRCVISSIAKG